MTNLSSALHRLSLYGRMLVIGALLHVSDVATAQVREGGDPVGAMPKGTSVTESFDRGAPRAVAIWTDEQVAFNGSNTWSYAGFCLSASDPTLGACPTSDSAGSPTRILMRFEEQRTHLTVDLYADATRRELGTISQVSNEFGLSDFTRLYSLVVSIRATVVLSESELRKIPTGGIWKAKLAVQMVFGAPKDPTDDALFPDARWEANVELRVSDDDHIDIYLPEFGDAPALIDLNLQGRPLAAGPGSVLTGKHVIDACLYDGYNANSSSVDITVDSFSGSAADTDFRVRHELASAPGNPSDEIPYRVTAPNPMTGQPMSFLAGKRETFSGSNDSGWRVVRLPFSSSPVICTPWPITLEAGPINSATQQAGRYSGTLRITFSPSTKSP